MKAFDTRYQAYGTEWVHRGKPYTRYTFSREDAEAFGNFLIARGRTNVAITEVFENAFGDFVISDFWTLNGGAA